MRNSSSETLIIIVCAVLLLFLILKPGANGDSNRLFTLPVSFSIGGNASNSVSQGNDGHVRTFTVFCPKCSYKFVFSQ